MGADNVICHPLLIGAVVVISTRQSWVGFAVGQDGRDNDWDSKFGTAKGWQRKMALFLMSA